MLEKRRRSRTGAGITLRRRTPTSHLGTANFILKPTAPATLGADGAASQAGRAFAYTATPTHMGKTGVRRFCADLTGRIVSSTKETMLVQDGVCSQGLRTLAARTP